MTRLPHFACHGLAARLRQCYREQRERELAYRGKLTETVEKIATEPRPA